MIKPFAKKKLFFEKIFFRNKAPSYTSNWIQNTPLKMYLLTTEAKHRFTGPHFAFLSWCRDMNVAIIGWFPPLFERNIARGMFSCLMPLNQCR